MLFNEEVQKFFEDALLEQKLTESILKVARPARSTERAPEWVERTNRILLVACCSPINRVSLCFGRANLLPIHRLLFSSL